MPTSGEGAEAPPLLPVLTREGPIGGWVGGVAALGLTRVGFLAWAAPLTVREPGRTARLCSAEGFL